MAKIDFKKYAIILLIVSLNSCELFEDYDKLTYFKVEGVGYVYNWYTKEPARDAIITVSSSFEGRGYSTVQPDHEPFSSDKNGYFCLKFLKRTHKSNVVGYTITAHDSENKLTLHGGILYTPNEIKELNILKLDTLWLK